MVPARTPLALTLLLLCTTAARADTVLDTRSLFGGRNPYAPTVILDGGTYKMWYSGWQTQADYPNDRIYYRTSVDNTSWSAPLTVLQPASIGPSVTHVGDPSVTKHFNGVSGTWQYTMFYTVCVNPCEQQHNQVWSSVSSDGINWHTHIPLLQSGSGPAEPSAIIDPQGDGTFWKVYYLDRFDPLRVKMVRVNGNRNGFAVQVVYTYPRQPVDINVISSAEVRPINGKWQLFFNAFQGPAGNPGGVPLMRVDLYKVESFSNESWGSNPYEVLISNGGPTHCATTTPGVLPAGGTDYHLYFGLVPRNADGTCMDLSTHNSIQRWTWRD